MSVHITLTCKHFEPVSDYFGKHCITICTPREKGTLLLPEGLVWLPMRIRGRH